MGNREISFRYHSMVIKHNCKYNSTQFTGKTEIKTVVALMPPDFVTWEESKIILQSFKVYTRDFFWEHPH